MTRIQKHFQATSVKPDADLVSRLAIEILENPTTGQPRIYEEEFSPGNLRVTVLWDDWHDVPMEVRTATILRAYQEAIADDSDKRIRLAMGLTIPEASSAGSLPVGIILGWRKSDPVPYEVCQKAMIEEGGSVLADPARPLLRFATVEEADACIQRLRSRVPGSDDFWIISQDVGRVDDWLAR